MLNLEEIKNRLELDLERITSELNHIGNYNAETDDWEAVPDPTELTESDSNSEADATEEWNERRATLSALETEYRHLKRALGKITAGTYGTCEISGEPIEIERLNILPTARTCLAHLDQESSLPL